MGRPGASAEGLGLVNPHPRLDAALERLAEAGGDAGVGPQRACCSAPSPTSRDVGRDHVDIDALAEFLAQVGEQYRSAAEVAGYGLEGMIAWALERAPERAAAKAALPRERATRLMRRPPGCGRRWPPPWALPPHGGP